MPYFAILFPLLFLACEEPQPLDRDFALAYAELRIAEHEHGETEEGKAARFQILQKRNLDLKTFQEKLDDVKKEDANWVPFQKMVVEIIDSISKEGKEKREAKEKKEVKENKEIKAKKDNKDSSDNKEKRKVRKKGEQK